MIFAGVAQLVEHDLAKVGVASSSLVSRSKFLKEASGSFFFVPQVNVKNPMNVIGDYGFEVNCLNFVNININYNFYIFRNSLLK